MPIEFCFLQSGPRQANLVLIAYASSEGSGEPAHPRSLARTFAARSYKPWVKRNFQTESQIPGPSEWLGMRSWKLSWRNARRHKFAWRGSVILSHWGLYNGYRFNQLSSITTQSAKQHQSLAKTRISLTLWVLVTIEPQRRLTIIISCADWPESSLDAQAIC